MVQAHPEAQKPSDFREAFLLLPGTLRPKNLSPVLKYRQKPFFLSFCIPKSRFQKHTPHSILFIEKRKRIFIRCKTVLIPYIYRIYTKKTSPFFIKTQRNFEKTPRSLLQSTTSLSYKAPVIPKTAMKKGVKTNQFHLDASSKNNTPKEVTNCIRIT